MPKQCIKCTRPNYGGGDQCGRCLDKAVEKYFGLKEGIIEETFGPADGDRFEYTPGYDENTTEENWGNEGGAN